MGESVPTGATTNEGWTVETLKEHIEKQMSLEREQVRTALISAQQAVSKAEAAMEKRFDSVNEFRKTLSDQSINFLTKDTYEAKHVALQLQVDDLRLNRASLEGKASQTSMMIALGISVISVLMSMIPLINSFLNRHDISSMIKP